MLRHSYVVVEPPTVEGFRRYVLSQMQESAPIHVQAIISDGLSRRRAGMDLQPVEFMFKSVVRINNEPIFMPTLYSAEHDQDVTFTIIGDHVTFGIWQD